MTASTFYDVNPEDIDHIVGVTQKMIEQDLKKLYEEDPHSFAEKMKRKKNEIYVNI